MSWGHHPPRRDPKELLAMTLEQRAAMTWEDAHDFVEADTLAMARFHGTRKRIRNYKPITPWGAAMLMHFTPENEDEEKQCYES